MTLLARKHPVQLLHDARGIYGIGVVSSAVEKGHGQPPEIILRPDRLLEARTRAVALQMITGGFRRGMFSRMTEERLRKAIHWEMLRRKGLNWPPRSRWWSDDAQEQARNRQIYHGLRLKSLQAELVSPRDTVGLYVRLVIEDGAGPDDRNGGVARGDDP
jgi:hypothetical protein